LSLPSTSTARRAPLELAFVPRGVEEPVLGLYSFSPLTPGGWADLLSELALPATLRRLNQTVLVGGFGDTDCNSSFSLKLMKLADRAGISYLAWTWNTGADYGGCANALLGPKVPASSSGPPSGYGKGVRKHYRAVAR